MSNQFFSDALKTAQSWSKKYPSAEAIPDQELPETFDQRNINKFDFTTKVRDQGHCGSCYTQAFVSAVES